MGQMIEFPSNGATARGYLSTASGSGPGVLVIQEWWGVVPELTGKCDRLSGEGFVTLAPDLYHGEIAAHTEMDKAATLMDELPMDRAARDMGAAIDALLARPEVTGDKVGVIGFCMGGMLTLVIAAREGGRVAAAVPFYGAPLGEGGPDFSNLTAAVQGHFAEHDDFFPWPAVEALGRDLREMGKDVEFVLHPGTGHAFANDENSIGNHHPEEAARAWASAVEFLHTHLG